MKLDPQHRHNPWKAKQMWVYNFYNQTHRNKREGKHTLTQPDKRMNKIWQSKAGACGIQSERDI